MGKSRKQHEEVKRKIKKRKGRKEAFPDHHSPPPPAMQTSKHFKAAIYFLLLGGTGGELRTLLESPEPSQETDPAKTAPSARREVH